MTIRWINEYLGTAPAADIVELDNIKIIDVRDLVDKAGNQSETIKEKIMTGVKYLQSGEKTIVCCDYGISRSNAVAIGIIAIHNQISMQCVWCRKKLVKQR